MERKERLYALKNGCEKSLHWYSRRSQIWRISKIHSSKVFTAKQLRRLEETIDT
ncbi:MAG: hypothetical protein QXI11_05545 [Thermoproteota archaeon]